MNTETGEVKQMKDLPPEELASGKWVSAKQTADGLYIPISPRIKSKSEIKREIYAAVVDQRRKQGLNR